MNPDIQVTGGATLYAFHALTERGREWIEQNVSPEGYQPLFPTRIYVEHRYARDLAQGLLDDGLEVK